jgi:hypothetical protein
MEQQILGFRERVESHFGGRPRRGNRYSAKLKEQAVELALAMVDQSDRLGSVASALGVGVGTLQRWMDVPSDSPARMREVEMVDAGRALVQDRSARRGLTLATASGHRVEGLALAEVALLLEALE